MRAFGSSVALGGIMLACLLLVPAAQAAAQAEARAAVARAMGMEQARDYRAARIEAMNATRAAPGWAVPHILHARVAIALGDGPGARDAIAAARKAGADDRAMRVLAAHAALLEGEPQRALDELARGDVAPGREGYAARLRGTALLAIGAFDDARAAFNDAIAIDPRDAATWTAIARFRLASADPVGAEEAVDFAIKIDPRGSDAARLKAALVRDRYGLLASLPWFERALEIAPADVDTLVDYAATLGDAGRYRAMLVAARRANALAPGDPRPLFLEAVLAARAGRYTLARALLERTQETLGDQPSYMLVRGIVENALGAPNVALDWAGRLLAHQPGNEHARRLLIDASLAAGDATTAWAAANPLVVERPAESWTLLAAASAFAAAGRRGQPVDLLDQAAGFPGVAGAVALGERAVEPEAGGDAAGAALPQIRTALKRGDTGGATALAVTLIDAAPGVAAARIIAGDVALADGDVSLAIVRYREALSIRVDEAAALRLVDAYLRMDNRPAATEVLGSFIAVAPRSIAANRVAAAFYLDARDWGNAIATLEALRVRLGNRDALLLSQLGRAYLGAGDNDAALGTLRSAYALQPANAGVSSLLGLALLRSGGDRNRARDLAEKAVAIEPGNTTFRERLIDARN